MKNKKLKFEFTTVLKTKTHYIPKKEISKEFTYIEDIEEPVENLLKYKNEFTSKNHFKK